MIPDPETRHLRRTDWAVWPIPDHSIAMRLIRAWHYSGGAPNSSVYRHGLYQAVFTLGDPHGVALWIPPTMGAAEHVAPGRAEGVLSLSRLVIEPDMPTNSASFLLSRSMRLIDRGRWPVLVTYADTAQGHTGAIYRATNWHCDGPVPAGDVWIAPNGRLTSRKHGRYTLTAAQMIERGYTRRPALPKIRFRHEVAP